MAISIIIPTYNEEKTIPDLLAHLSAGINHLKDAEILVIDGGSTDNTVELVSNWDSNVSVPNVKAVLHR